MRHGNFKIFRILWAVIPFIFISSSFSKEDSYHLNLRDQLKNSFNIEGGAWVLTDQENTTNKLAALTRVSKKTESYSGKEPFTEVVRLTAATKGTNPWDNAVRFNTKTAIKKDDALLLVIWVRGIEGDEDYGRIQHIFEMTSDPYTKDLNLGQSPATVWQQWMIPFQAGRDHEIGKARYQINMGYMAQIIEVAGLAILNYGSKYTVEELPRSDFDLDYEGRDPDAPWRAAAQQRIEQHRMAPITVNVVNKFDQPVKNAAVEVNMLQHEFGFGTAIAISRMLDNSNDGVVYQDMLADLTGDEKTFNIVVVENGLKWPPWENTSWGGTRQETADVVSWFRDQDIKVRGHNLVWPGWQYLPDDIEEHKDDTTYISQRIKDHIFEIAGFKGIKGEIAEWDVINENAHNFDLRNVYGSEDMYIDWFKWAKTADPDAKLYLNEYSIINNSGLDLTSQQRFKDLIQFHIDNGAPLDGIGIQGHFGLPLTSPERVYTILEEFAIFGKDISITEYDAAGVEEELAADYIRDLMTICFSHPSVKNFLMWGFWDGQHWHKDAPIFNRDWSLKPSGQMFIDQVFSEWWTNKTGKTNAQGIFTTTGYLGTYEVLVSYDDIKNADCFTLTKANGAITVKLNSDVTGLRDNTAPFKFKLDKNYPNPFNPQTKIQYSVPKKSRVKLEIFNTSGQMVAQLVNEVQQPGIYDKTFDASRLPSGVYFYKLQADGLTQSAKMLFMK